MYIVNRHRYSTVKRISEHTLFAKALLSDTYHELVLEMEVSLGLFEIKKVEVQVLRAPFEMCFTKLEKMQELKGLSITKGISKKVVDLIGGTRGCAHLFDLTIEATKAVIQAGFHLQENPMTVEEKKAMFSEFFGMELKRTCHTYDKLID